MVQRVESSSGALDAGGSYFREQPPGGAPGRSHASLSALSVSHSADFLHAAQTLAASPSKTAVVGGAEAASPASTLRALGVPAAVSPNAMDADLRNVQEVAALSAPPPGTLAKYRHIEERGYYTSSDRVGRNYTLASQGLTMGAIQAGARPQRVVEPLPASPGAALRASSSSSALSASLPSPLLAPSGASFSASTSSLAGGSPTAAPKPGFPSALRVLAPTPSKRSPTKSRQQLHAWDPLPLDPSSPGPALRNAYAGAGSNQEGGGGGADGAGRRGLPVSGTGHSMHITAADSVPGAATERAAARFWEVVDAVRADRELPPMKQEWVAQILAQLPGASRAASSPRSRSPSPTGGADSPPGGYRREQLVQRMLGEVDVAYYRSLKVRARRRLSGGFILYTRAHFKT